MGSEVCPYCNAHETRESDRDYPHWRQFDCGSLLIGAKEGDIDQSQKCRVRQRDLMVEAAKGDFGNAVVALMEKDARIAALEKEVERVKGELAIAQAHADLSKATLKRAIKITTAGQKEPT